MDTMPGLEPVPTHRVTEVPAGPPAAAPAPPAWVAPVMAGFEALAKRGGNWVPGVVAGILSGVLAVLAHDQISNVNLDKVLERQEDRIDEQADRLDDIDDDHGIRLDDIEDNQRQLIELHRHEQALAAWRDDSMEALAGKLGVKLTQRPQRSNLPVVQPRRR